MATEVSVHGVMKIYDNFRLFVKSELHLEAMFDLL